VYGYEKFPARLPSGAHTLVDEFPSLVWERRLKDMLVGAGLTEVYSFAFLSEQQLELFDKNRAIKLKNPLTVDQAYLRPSLVPSMLTTIKENQRRFQSGDLFEIAPVYRAKKNDVPDQIQKLLIAVYGKDGAELYARAKGILERLFRQSGVRTWSYSREKAREHLHPARQARVFVGKKEVGHIGQINQELNDAFGLEVDVVTVSVDIDDVLADLSTHKFFKALPQFPSVKRDVAFAVYERVEYASVVEALHKTSSLLESVELFDVYRGGNVAIGKKSLALHLNFLSSKKTLEAKEIDGELESIRDVLEKSFGAILR
jgi:phenylalanyl-tRNA synthetase beta chain